MRLSRKFLTNSGSEKYRGRVNEFLGNAGECMLSSCSPFYGSFSVFRLNDPHENDMSYICGVHGRKKELYVVFPFRPSRVVIDDVKRCIGGKAKSYDEETDFSRYLLRLQRRHVAGSDCDDVFSFFHLTGYVPV